jgi:hypothetical protein
MHKLGLREPELGLFQTMRYLHNENTGMEYEQFADVYGQLYMAVWHEDVGQVTWYSITADDWDDLLQDSTEHIA